ncbi:acetylxylan esterase [Niastella yeongjuensis]|uniref:Acetylxylan esterase n=1 Tax=Niastella yeongjuensis TaxID=354355 RepID=A0A1V9E106_9BACT|nr:sialate O-acetylesterase [Niastella yeongjuensis]OQP39790.1 acetylxylan esterase [Niastella yeongjuensis]SEO05531.1 protein of unknown function [Niastella yeongjuensis]
MKRYFLPFSHSLLLFIFYLIPFYSKAQTQPEEYEVHYYLLIGQSNMAGRGPLDSADNHPNPRIIMLDSLNQWKTATDPVHFDKPKLVGVGPAISFAKEMTGKDKHIMIALIPCALGGSPINVWEPGATYFNWHPYDDAIARVKIALHKGGQLKGVLWHQGESDNDSAHAIVYLEKLKTLITRLRTEFNNPKLPFVAGEIGYFNKQNIINPVLNHLPDLVPYTAVVSAKDLTDKGDQLHFDTPSARKLGKRYADAMTQIQKSTSNAMSIREN